MAEVEKEFASIIRKQLFEKFRDEFVYDPILVQTGLDLDGDRYLHAYVVFEGDRRKLGSGLDGGPVRASVAPYPKTGLSGSPPPVLCHEVRMARITGVDPRLVA